MPSASAEASARGFSRRWKLLSGGARYATFPRRKQNYAVPFFVGRSPLRRAEAYGTEGPFECLSSDILYLTAQIPLGAEPHVNLPLLLGNLAPGSHDSCSNSGPYSFRKGRQAHLYLQITRRLVTVRSRAVRRTQYNPLAKRLLPTDSCRARWPSSSPASHTSRPIWL